MTVSALSVSGVSVAAGQVSVPLSWSVSSNLRWVAMVERRPVGRLSWEPTAWFGRPKVSDASGWVAIDVCPLLNTAAEYRVRLVDAAGQFAEVATAPATVSTLIASGTDLVVDVVSGAATAVQVVDLAELESEAKAGVHQTHFSDRNVVLQSAASPQWSGKLTLLVDVPADGSLDQFDLVAPFRDRIFALCPKDPKGFGVGNMMFYATRTRLIRPSKLGVAKERLVELDVVQVQPRGRVG